MHYENLAEVDPALAIESLIDDIESSNLDFGIKNSLISKLQNTLKLLEKGQNHTVSNLLSAFINEANAQRGKKLTDGQADALISDAQNIIESIQNG